MPLLLDYSKTFLKDLVLPPTGLLLLAIVGALLLRRRPRLGGALLATGLAALWLLSLPVIADSLARSSQHYGALDVTRPVTAQAIVILGGGGQRRYALEYRGPAAEPYLLERLAYGAYLARTTGLPILVTGFGIEAVAMRATLQRNFAIEPRWVDGEAYDTFGNAHDSARLLRASGVSRVLLVTSALHMWRSVHEFTAAGLDVVPAPMALIGPHTEHVTAFDFLPDGQSLLLSTAVSYEWLGERVRMALAATHLRGQHSTQRALPRA